MYRHWLRRLALLLVCALLAGGVAALAEDEAVEIMAGPVEDLTVEDEIDLADLEVEAEPVEIPAEEAEEEQQVAAPEDEDQDACPHTHTETYTYISTEGAIYGAIDNKYHYITGKEVTSTYCTDCWLTLNEVVGEVKTQDEWHNYDGNGVCKDCGHVNTCTHQNVETETNWDWEKDYDYVSVDNTYHNITGTQVLIKRCADCGIVVSETSNGIKTEREMHSYSPEGKCYVCAHVNTCPHAHVYEDTYIDDSVSVKYEAVDNRVHRITGEQIGYKRCEDCDMELSSWSNGIQTMEYGHDYSSAGFCIKCGHKNTCTHPTTEVNIWYDGDSDYQNVDAKTHQLKGSKFEEEYCNECWMTMKRKSHGYGTYTDYHEYDQNGKCRCGATTNVPWLALDGTDRLGKGEAHKLRATGVDINGNEAKIGITYSSSDSKVVSVDRKGKLKAKRNGTATITVLADNGVHYTWNITVMKAPKSIKLNEKKVTLEIDRVNNVPATFQLEAKLSSNSASTVTYTTSNKKVATVDSRGRITAVGPGKATITAKTFNGKKATCKVTVKDPYAPKSVKLLYQGKKKLTMKLSDAPIQLIPELSPGTALTTYKWKSSSKKVVKVDENGVITPRKTGKAKITVVTANGKKATISVTVKK